MNETVGTILLALIALVAIIFLLMRFDVVKFGFKLPGVSTEAEGRRHSAAKTGTESVRSSGTGAVALGDGGEEADIETNVKGTGKTGGNQPAPAATTEASGTGSVAVSGGGKKAKIRTNVIDGSDEEAKGG